MAEQRQINPWLIAVSVMLATFMEVLDTTVVNVSLPHIAGSLSVSIDEATWALTSYLGANAITQDFANESKLKFDEAEKIKIAEGFVSLGGAYEEPDNPYQAAISKIARQFMTRLHIQVNQTMLGLGLDPQHPPAPGQQVSIARPAHWGGYRLWADRVELWSAGPGRIHDRAEAVGP